MKILVTGDRNWNDEDTIRQVLIATNADLVLIGDAEGADKITKNLCIELGINYKRFRAYWNMYGTRAGPIRNKEMLDEKPDLVCAFHDNIKESKGTKNCIEQAIKMGYRVQLFKSHTPIYLYQEFNTPKEKEDIFI